MNRGTWTCLAAAIGACLSSTVFAQTRTYFRPSSGELRIYLSEATAVSYHGAASIDETSEFDAEISATSLGLDDGSVLSLSNIDGELIVEGTIILEGALHFDRPARPRTLRQLGLRVETVDGVIRMTGFDAVDPEVDAFVAVVSDAEVDPVGGTILLHSHEIALSTEWAPLRRGSERMDGLLLLRARLEQIGGELKPTSIGDNSVSILQGTVAGETPNPDLIVGTLLSVGLYGQVNGIGGYSIGATSCNIGTDPANWFSQTPAHPVISQTLFRLKENRFEQIGISWVKHGYTALTGSVCCPTGPSCCQSPGTGSLLGVGCSDPYTSQLNGDQNALGPRFHIDAFTGVFPFPAARPPMSNPPLVTERRMQVRQSDLDPALNAGATYFGEIQYVAADDSLAGNQDNNASYKEAIVLTQQTLGAYTLTFPGAAPTIRQKSAINVWKVRDPSVELIELRVPGEGLFHLAAKVTDLGNGVWEYEYALYNMNSHRSAGSFSVPIRPGVVIQNIGFHDVDYHSGEPYDGTDWAVTLTDDAITWATTPYAVNENANALRWGTLYNFRFQMNTPPADTTIDIGLFRPGAPDGVAARIVGPALDLIDCNDNEVDDLCDIDCDVLGCVAPCGGSIDCNDNGVPDECEPDCNGNDQADGCDISQMLSDDCNGNTVPDECESDCDNDGVPDSCDPDTTVDCDGDGIFGCDDICPCSSPTEACVCPFECICCLPPDVCFLYVCADCFEIGGTPSCIEAPCRMGCTYDEITGDNDWDGDHDLSDVNAMVRCFTDQKEKPQFTEPSERCLARFDIDIDDDVDLDDLDLLIGRLSGPAGGPK